MPIVEYAIIRAIIADPLLVDEIPNDATVYIEYDDDPALTDRNRSAAVKKQGHRIPIHAHRIRSSSPRA